MLPALKSVRNDRCFQRINKLKSISLNEDGKLYLKFKCFIDTTISTKIEGIL